MASATMKAVVFKGECEVEVVEMPRPVIEQPGDCIVQVTLAGICGSDLHPYHLREKGLDVGCVMGHEFVGKVVEVGDKVANFKPGDVVCTPFTTSCGACFYCSEARLPCRCAQGQLFGWREQGRGLHGGQAEFVRVPLADGTLVARPDGLTDLQALLLGDVLSTGFHAAANTLAGVRDPARETFCVVGLGPVGLCACASLLHLGAKAVFAIDCVPERLALAEAFGCRPLDFTRRGSPVEEVVRAATGGRGADGAVEAVGAESALKTAMRVLRPGGVLSSVGVCTSEALPFSPAQCYDTNLTFHAGRCPARYRMTQAQAVLASGRFPLERIVSHHLPIDDAARGYTIFDKKTDNCTKVVLVTGGGGGGGGEQR